jgi:hypothetical protein
LAPCVTNTWTADGCAVLSLFRHKIDPDSDLERPALVPVWLYRDSALPVPAMLIPKCPEAFQIELTTPDAF